MGPGVIREDFLEEVERWAGQTGLRSREGIGEAELRGPRKGQGQTEDPAPELTLGGIPGFWESLPWLENPQGWPQALRFPQQVYYHISWFLPLVLRSCLFPHNSMSWFYQFGVSYSIIRAELWIFSLCIFLVILTCPSSLFS